MSTNNHIENNEQNIWERPEEGDDFGENLSVEELREKAGLMNTRVEDLSNEVEDLEKGKHKLTAQEKKQLGENTADLQTMEKENPASEAAIKDSETLFQKFKEEAMKVYEGAKGAIDKAIDTLLVKPGKFVWKEIKAHPVITIAMVLALAGMWYFAPALQYGASAAMEEVAGIIGEIGKAVLPGGSVVATKRLTEIANELIKKAGGQAVLGEAVPVS